MITAVMVTVVLVTFLYVGFILFSLAGFFSKNEKIQTFSARVAVVVAFRNEQNNLPHLIESLKRQSFPVFDIILVDDHSTNSDDFVFPAGVTVIRNEGTGKKQALLTACRNSSADMLVFTDADCIHETNWLQGMVDPLQNHKTGLVIGGVAPSNPASFFALDDLSLSAASIGAARIGFPFACSGASMACRRNDFMEWNPYRHNLPQQSGDDVYLLNACLSHGKKVYALTSPETLVHHPAAYSLCIFFTQRMRWGQKTGIDSWRSFAVGLVVLLYSMIIYAGMALCFINLKGALICLAAFIIGAIVNFLFLFLVARHWKVLSSMVWFLPAYVFHLGYIPWAAVLGKIHPLTWKGRRVESRN